MTTMLHPLMRLHFLLLVLLFCVSPSTFSTNPFILPSDVACRPHQIQALTEFMNEFDTNHCNHSDPFSEVLCDNSTGEITAIGLGSCLGGTLTPNSSLFRLHHLRYLDLRQNNFVSSTLPYEFGNLNRLEYLSLPNNSFVGQVPSSLSNLSQLSYLDLSQNKLTGSFPLVRNLTKLSILSLANNHFSGPLNPNNRLFELQNLHHLDLGFNNFSSSLPSEFGNLHRLKVLSLSSNDFFGQVPLTISNLTLLTKLSLDRNMLTGSFPLVRNLTNLVSLELSNNLFSGTLNPNSSLFELRNLTYLNLARNNFTSPLPSQFGNFKRLTVLDLSFNNFFGQVPNTISNLTSLAMLALSNNYLAGSFPYSLTTLPSSPRLTYLSLGHNYFEGKIIKSISNLITLQILDLSYLNISYPVDLSRLSSLKSLLYLDLSGNAISPASLGSNSDIPPNLEMLYLSHCGIKEFPNFVKSLHNLLYIHIGNNKIKGKVPEWLWSSLPRLNSVVAVNNSFNGFEGPADVMLNSSVDSIFLQLNLFEGAIPILPLSIKVFAAQENRFTGRIPLSICGYKSLTHLVLPYNNLTGPIPRCLSSLTVLNLRKNNLEGSIINVFNETLQTLDVGYNRLTGKLPRSLANCSALVFLNVENNRIKDTFPFWLKALPNLQVLILRSNRFYGSISPPDEGPLGFPELQIFEISDNSFNGSLPPDYFVNWKASSLQMNEDMGGIYMEFQTGGYGRGEEGILSGIFLQFTEVTDLRIKGLSMEQANVLTTYATIDFSGNKLEGQIPESIGLLQGLIALNLSNNAFLGCIPLSLANLTELESLDLSSNKLSGTIPNGLGSLSFLAYVNVSHNQLKGEIPQGTQITGQPKSSFEGNAGLCGFPLEEICFGSNAPPMQQPKEEEEEEEEELLNWKAVVMGYGAGVLIGLTIAQVIASYKLEWLIKSC